MIIHAVDNEGSVIGFEGLLNMFIRMNIEMGQPIRLLSSYMHLYSHI